MRLIAGDDFAPSEAGPLRGHQLPCRMLQAAHTGLPFPYGALRFAAIELTKGMVLGNLADKLSPNTVADVSKRVHVAPPIAFNFSNIFKKTIQIRHATALFRYCQ